MGLSAAMYCSNGCQAGTFTVCCETNELSDESGRANIVMCCTQCACRQTLEDAVLIEAMDDEKPKKEGT